MTIIMSATRYGSDRARVCVLSFPRDCASNSGDLSYKRTLAHTINCGGPVFGLCHYNLIESAVGSNSAILLTKPLTHTHTHTHHHYPFRRAVCSRWPNEVATIRDHHKKCAYNNMLARESAGMPAHKSCILYLHCAPHTLTSDDDDDDDHDDDATKRACVIIS